MSSPKPESVVKLACILVVDLEDPSLSVTYFIRIAALPGRGLTVLKRYLSSDEMFLKIGDTAFTLASYLYRFNDYKIYNSQKFKPGKGEEIVWVGVHSL